MLVEDRQKCRVAGFRYGAKGTAHPPHCGRSEAIKAAGASWIASSLSLLAMTIGYTSGTVACSGGARYLSEGAVLWVST